MQNRLILGDNLQVLKSIPSESVDLCYIDPPFFSNRNYEVIWGDSGEVRSFTDRWAGGMEHYIGWLKERIDEIWRVLKPTGSLFVHCDWHANAYIRVHILDKLQPVGGGGKPLFVNEIAWCYRGGSAPRSAFGRRHDTIFFYRKSNEHTFNADAVRIAYRAEGVGRKDDAMWGRHKGTNKVYKPNPLGKIPEDWWEINVLNANSPERIGYPTQKPLALLERIIKACSNEGDIVLDAFCGGGTTLVAAHNLKRHFIGIDQSVHAIAVTRARLENDLFRPTFSVETPKYDYETIRNAPPFQFERFIVEQYGGESHTKQVGDGGIDGLLHEGRASFPIQVKRSDNIGRNVIDNFKSAMSRFNKQCKRGYIIAFSFGRGAVEEVARLKREEDFEITLVRVDEIIPIGMPPRISLSFDWKEVGDKGDKEVIFKATGDDIELWQWDWDYDAKKGFAAEVLRNNDGIQKIILKTGKYDIAVRGVDRDGIASIEVIHLVVNGGVHKE